MISKILAKITGNPPVVLFDVNPVSGHPGHESFTSVEEALDALRKRVKSEPLLYQPGAHFLIKEYQRVPRSLKWDHVHTQTVKIDAVRRLRMSKFKLGLVPIASA